MAALNELGVIGTIGEDDDVPDLDEEQDSDEEVNGISKRCTFILCLCFSGSGFPESYILHQNIPSCGMD